MDIIQHFHHEIDKNNRIFMTRGICAAIFSSTCEYIISLSHSQSHDNPILLLLKQKFREIAHL